MTKEEQLYKHKEEKPKPKRLRQCKYCKDKTVEYGAINPFCFKNECIRKHNEVTIAAKKRQAKTKLRNNNKSAIMKDCQEIAQKIGRIHGYLSGIYYCVTCNITLQDKKVDGGHFLPKNNWSAIKLYTLQIHPQCVKCNQFNSGQRSEYKEFMIKRYGLEKTEWLESFKGVVSKKHTLEYLLKYKRVMGKRVKILEKRLQG